MLGQASYSRIVGKFYLRRMTDCRPNIYCNPIASSAPGGNPAYERKLLSNVLQKVQSLILGVRSLPPDHMSEKNQG